ncbi:MAG: hypothetical protein JNN15_13085, partial [Blastocatellia bacterium]|nr:hypothetical protein [Blastocatellia bacterium]
MNQDSKERGSMPEKAPKPNIFQRLFIESTFIALLALSIVLGTDTGLPMSNQTA